MLRVKNNFGNLFVLSSVVPAVAAIVYGVIRGTKNNARLERNLVSRSRPAIICCTSPRCLKAPSALTFTEADEKVVLFPENLADDTGSSKIF